MKNEALALKRKTGKVKIMAHVPHPTEFIEDELLARGWTADELAARMCEGKQENWGIHRLALDFYFEIGPDDTNMRLGEASTKAIASAFGVNPDFFTNLENAWLRSKGVEI